jgi:hypothetical protein
MFLTMQNILKRITIMLLTCTSLTGLAQDYDTGIGVRGGVAWGLTVKHFITTDGAGELILTRRHNGFNTTGLFEQHLPVFDTEGFYFFYGGGVHLGLWNTDQDKVLHDLKVYAGIDGIIGLEYSLEDLPLSVGLDWKPGINIISDFGLFIDDIAVSVRFLLD